MILEKDANGHTAVSYLSHKFKHSSREIWKARLEQGQISLNGFTLQHDTDLVPGQILVWQRPPWREESVPLNYTCVYEDCSLVVVSKPSGLPTMPAGGFLNNTLYMLVQQDYPDARPLHRLGRGTSGLVIFARNKKAFSALSQQWQHRQVKKEYVALATGQAQQETFVINTSIGRVPHPKLGQVYAAHVEGKTACSQARVIKTQPSATLFEVTIKTGRPHQIRIHLASIGHPLLGDPLYGPGGLPVSAALPGEGGYFLHATRLECLHPATGQPLRLADPVPQDFKQICLAYQLV